MRAPDPARAGLRRWAIAGIVAVVLGTGAVVATYTPLFGARDIRVEGARTISRDHVLRLAGLGPSSNVFHLDTGMVERRLERDTRILDARVTTSLPDAVVIRITPRLPVAVVGIPADLVGADGVVIGRADTPTGLPALTSEGGGPAAGAHLRIAAAAAAAMSADLRHVVDEVAVDDGGRIEVRLAAGFSADLGDDSELIAKAASLAALLDWVTERGVKVVSADLTVPGSPTARLERTGAAVPVP